MDMLRRFSPKKLGFEGFRGDSKGFNAQRSFSEQRSVVPDAPETLPRVGERRWSQLSQSGRGRGAGVERSECSEYTGGS